MYLIYECILSLTFDFLKILKLQWNLFVNLYGNRKNNNMNDTHSLQTAKWKLPDYVAFANTT